MNFKCYLSEKNTLFSCIVFLFILILIRPAHGQLAVTDQWQTQNLQVEHGLPDSTVFSITQDQSGFMWFGTTNGLARYDGYAFKVFKHDGADQNSISNNNAGNLFIDSKNKLWIGTFGGGVNSLDLSNGHLERHPYSSSQIDQMVSENVQTFYEDLLGNLWIGTATGLYQKTAETLTHYDYQLSDPKSLSHSRVWDITEDQHGAIWVGTSDGLSQLDLTTGQFENYKLPDELTLDISSNQFRTLYMTQSILWVGSSSGLYSFSLETKEFSYHPTSDINIKINNIYPQANGNLLIGSMEGLFEFNILTNSFTINKEGHYWQPLAQYDIRDIYVDESNLMWLATRDNGVIKVNQTVGLFHLENTYTETSTIQEKASQVWAIAPNSSGGILLGTSESVFSGDSEHVFNRVTTDELNMIPGISRDIKPANDGGYWVGSSTGLYYMAEHEILAKAVTKPFDLVGMEPTDVFSVEETENGELWLALYNVGILRWHPDSNRAALIQSYANGSLTDLNLGHLTLDKHGNIWVASNLVGVFNYNFKNKQMILYRHDFNDSSSISSNRVKDIFEDSKGRLWIATARGLNQFNFEHKSFKRFNFNNALLGDSV
ncbi:MAG: ligand-binding sensor domain-containing protein, partial [Marinicella sp.]